MEKTVMIDKNNRTVGIVTINDYTNYGNRLQNIAFTIFLENAGYSVINGIQVFTKEAWVYSTSSVFRRLLKHLLPYKLVKGRLYKSRQIIDPLLMIRKERFCQFCSIYLKTIDPIIAATNRQALRVLEKYGIDKYISGSDQVWNPYYEGRAYEFLLFAPKDKRLSYAASFGVDTIPRSQQYYYKRCINDLSYISVREENGAKIVYELTKRDSHISVDPTLLLNSNSWEGIVVSPKFSLPKEYICTYFLGEKPMALSSFAKAKNLEIIELNNRDYEELFTINPGEFLYILKNANYILTDSYHAVVFSIIFRKQFYVFKRKQENTGDMFSRIETITEQLQLEDRIQNREIIIENDHIIDWDLIERKIDNLRNLSVISLMEALEK